MILSEAYDYSLSLLKEHNTDEADFKALCVCCHLAGIKNSMFRLCGDREVDKALLDEMLCRLADGEPLQYVIGKWDFYESEFFVGKGALIPRPETEELTELVIDYVKKLDSSTVYDLCAGTGCIGLSVAKACPNATVTLVEKSPDAFGYLRKNAENTDNAKIVCADINNTEGFISADVIVSNPPYIRSDDIAGLQSEVLAEPLMALDGGDDGLDFYRIINDKWYELIKPDGRLFLEIGNEQGSAIKDILTNFNDIEVKKDIYGNDRMVVAVRRD